VGSRLAERGGSEREEVFGRIAHLGDSNVERHRGGAASALSGIAAGGRTVVTTMLAVALP
jgi:hypothetical protein